MIPSVQLQRIKSALGDAFQGRLRGVVLYGSEARGQARDDSDIDLLILLAGPVDQDEDSWTCIRALYPFVLEMERPIHAKPTDIRVYERQELPLYRTARREGVLA
jgi:uncharacterized protein